MTGEEVFVELADNVKVSGEMHVDEEAEDVDDDELRGLMSE